MRLFLNKTEKLSKKEWSMSGDNSREDPEQRALCNLYRILLAEIDKLNERIAHFDKMAADLDLEREDYNKAIAVAKEDNAALIKYLDMIDVKGGCPVE